MTVWVLENGCYSDTRIVGIYSSRSLAEVASRIFRDDANITEWDLDHYSEDMLSGRVPWFVRLARDSGDTLESHQEESSYGAFSSAVGEDVHKNLYTHVWATDRDMAIKIAGDRRRMFLAAPPQERQP